MKSIQAANQGTYLTTLHHPESVVEVYFDQEQALITEIKHLNHNRAKSYAYSVEEYLDRCKRFKGLDEKIKEMIA